MLRTIRHNNICKIITKNIKINKNTTILNNKKIPYIISNSRPDITIINQNQKSIPICDISNLLKYSTERLEQIYLHKVNKYNFGTNKLTKIRYTVNQYAVIFDAFKSNYKKITKSYIS